MGIFTNDIIIAANTDGAAGTTKITYSDFLTGKLLGLSYIPTTGSHYTTGNSAGDYELIITRRSTGATQDDIHVKKFKVYPSRRHFGISSPIRATTGGPISTTEFVPYLPLADEQLRVIVAPATSANSKNAIIRLLMEGSPSLLYKAT